MSKGNLEQASRWPTPVIHRTPLILPAMVSNNMDKELPITKPHPTKFFRTLVDVCQVDVQHLCDWPLVPDQESKGKSKCSP